MKEISSVFNKKARNQDACNCGQSTQSGQLACTLQVDMHGLGKVDPSRPSSGELRNNFGQHRATADFCWAPRVQQHQF
eukprot:scaffold151990_cov17-Tisochrysis_lutea.AAC.1